MYFIILYASIAAVIAFFIMYLDTKLLDNPKEKVDYLRGMMLAGFVVGLVVAFVGEDVVGSAQSKRFGGIGYIADIKEEILTGKPTF